MNKKLIQTAKEIYIANKSDKYYSEITNCLFRAYLQINNLKYSPSHYEDFMAYAEYDMPELKETFEYIGNCNDYLQFSDEAGFSTFEDTMTFDYDWFKPNSKLDLTKYFDRMLNFKKD